MAQEKPLIIDGYLHSISRRPGEALRHYQLPGQPLSNRNSRASMAEDSPKSTT
jgi:hypothetical protein